MKSSRVVALVLLLALSLAEAAPPEVPGQNGNGPKNGKDVPQGPKQDVPQGPKNKDPYSPPPYTPPTTPSSPPPPVYSPPPPPQTLPPPPPPSPVYSPPPPPSPVYSPPPPPPTTPSPSPPPPATPSPSPPPPATPSPPPETPSPPPPVYSPPPQSPVVTPSPPSPVYSPPPQPPVVTPSPPPPVYSPPITTPSPPTTNPPPPSSSASGKRVRCKNKNYPSCYFREFTCPAACSQSCQVDCVTCSPVCDCNRPGAVCQDPRFVGADGIAFYFHGKKDQDFCLVSDSNIHINAHFIGKRNTNMGRDFTWVQALGILFDDHKLYIGAQKTATWNDAMDRISLSFDGQPIELLESEGASWESTTGSVRITRLRATNAVEIEAEGNFKIKAVVVPITEKDSLIHKYGITQEDCFAHLDLSFKFHSLSGQVNGVLGQTYGSEYKSRVKMGVAMSVLGGEKEFHSSGIFSTDCEATKFEGKVNGDESDEETMEFADLNCASSGFSGRGVVCRR